LAFVVHPKFVYSIASTTIDLTSKMSLINYWFSLSIVDK